MHSCFDGWELDRGWRRGGFSAAVVSCHEICRDARACFFLFFYVGVHVLCIRCPGKHGCLRAWPSSCHSESRPPVLFLLFLPFFSPLNSYFSFRTVIFALKHSYVMRRRVIRRVIRTVGPFLIFRTRVPSSRSLSRRSDHSYDCQARFVTFEKLFRGNALLYLSPVTRPLFLWPLLFKKRIEHKELNKIEFYFKKTFLNILSMSARFSLLFQIKVLLKCQYTWIIFFLVGVFKNIDT